MYQVYILYIGHDLNKLTEQIEIEVSWLKLDINTVECQWSRNEALTHETKGRGFESCDEFVVVHC